MTALVTSFDFIPIPLRPSAALCGRFPKDGAQPAELTPREETAPLGSETGQVWVRTFAARSRNPAVGRGVCQEVWTQHVTLRP
jgi:hypothetical protein